MDKRIWVVIAIVFIAIWLIPHSTPNADGDTDFPWSLVPAAKGEITDAYRGFVYPTMLKVFNFIWSDWMIAGRMISSVAMSLSILAIFMLAGWPGAYLLLLSPVFWFCGYSLTTDALAFMFMVGSCWAWKEGLRLVKYEKICEREGLRLNEEVLKKLEYADVSMLPLSGLLTGFACCTRYPMLILLALGLFIPWRKMWLFFAPALTLIGIQIFLNLQNSFGILGNNWQMNVLQKGAGLDFDIVKNLVTFPVRFMVEGWPLFGVVIVLAFAELIRRKRWELVIIGFGVLAIVSTTFYSARFFLPILLPLVIGGSMFIRRYTNGRSS